MPEFAPSADGGALGARSLAARLADARERMAALDLPGPLAAQLHRQFIAVCDSVKAAGADEQAGERRLAAFLAKLEQASARNPRYGNANDAAANRWGKE
jgi:hypothetical protein